MFSIIKKISHYAEWQARSQTLCNLVQADYPTEQHQKSLYEATAKMRHDIDNHMLVIQALLAQDRYNDAVNYSELLRDTEQNNNHFPNCFNSIIAIFLESKFDEIVHSGIKLSTDIQLPYSLNISNLDLVSVYGNILDNAAEACDGCSEPIINMKTVFQPPYVTISCLNSSTENHKKQTGSSEFPRGKGFYILSDIAKEYDGWFSAEPRGSQFYTEIVLKNRMEDKNAQNRNL